MPKKNKIKIRRNWKIKPVTKIVDSIKLYNRKKQKDLVRKQIKHELGD